MPYFKDADEVYATIGKLFQDLAEDDELSPKFQKANTIVQYHYREPQSTINSSKRGRRMARARVAFCSTSMRV